MVDSVAEPQVSEDAQGAARSEEESVPTSTSADDSPPDFSWLARDLLGRWAEQRIAGRMKAADPAYQRIDGLSMDEHRARVSGQIGLLAADGAALAAFPARLGGRDDPGGNVASFEEIVLADPSLQIKAGVQFGLFGSAILHLGTERHHEELLPSMMSLEVPGAFAMTETGHGSDVASIGTTATYDPSSQEFVIHTPYRAAWKDYLGNAAVDGRAAVVFAQLITQGERQGVHAFYVPIRDAEGSFLRGVGGEDDGLKGGLNGVDNGRLHFDQVRIPRTNLLNRYGDVAPDGTYSSPIESAGRRFFTMLGTLVQGRVSLDGAAVVASKAALAIAIRYGAQRRQFHGRSAETEEVILDYRSHQRRLLVPLAGTYARAYLHDRLLGEFDSVFSGADDTAENRENLETLAAGAKSLSTWAALDILQECREACGGAGFLQANRLTQLRADLDVYVTFEGDNTVLLQLVGKRLLTDYARQFDGATASQLAQFAAKELAGKAAALIGVHRISQDVGDLWRASSASVALRRRALQAELMNDRISTMVGEVAMHLREVDRTDREAATKAFNEVQTELLAAAQAWTELQTYEAFADAVAKMPDGLRRVMKDVRDLYGLTLIEKDLAWYLANGRLSGARAKVVTSTIDRLLVRIRPHAVALVDAFGYGPEHLRAEIATDAESVRQAEAAATS